MENFSETYDSFYFLANGGEMGKLIRAKDWSKTPLGHPKEWPQSLRTAVAIMLDNPFGMYIAWGTDYTQIYNDGYRPILGSTKHPEALGISTRETFAEVWRIIGAMFDDVMKGVPIGFPDFMLPLDRHGYAEECYFDFSYSPIRKNNGEVGGVLVTVIETTNKKKSEDALKESEARFRTLADNIPNLAWMADAAGSIYWYNKQWYDYTGTTPDQMKGWGWQSIHHPEELARVLKKWRESIASGIPFEMVFPIKGADGKFRQFLTRVVPVHDQDGKIYQWFGTNTDVTERIIAEENLRNTILQAPVAMCIFKGPDHIVELANDRMFELWGKPSEGILNRPIFQGLPEAKDQGFESLVDGVYSTGETFSADGIPITLPRGGKIEIVYVNLVYSAYREPDGSISGILAVAVDVTAQILARQKIEDVVAERTKALAQANVDLQKSNEELAQFAYIASHDLQEPLRKISTFSQMLDNSLNKNIDDTSRSYINKINKSSSRMHTLIRDVLNYSQLVKENQIFQEVNLDEVVESIIAEYDLLIEQKGAVITITDLPTIQAIPLQMSQLFRNIIGNALKFSRTGHKPEVQITTSDISNGELEALSLNPGLEYFRIKIIDNGIGFKGEYAEQIFNIFQRLHRKSEFEGTGIGLAMCKKIVLNHQGEIDAKGSSENGAVFNVILPLQQKKLP
ncbi:MAG: PAS domain-containing protein [Chryseolinea sp.]